MFPLTTAGRIGISIGLLLAGVIALRLAEAVVVPLLVALLLATVLGPAAAWLQEKTKIQWSAACVVVILTLVLFNLLIFFVFSGSVLRVVTRMSDEAKIIDTYKKLRNNLEKVSPVPLDEESFPRNPVAIREIQVFQYLNTWAPSILREISMYSANWAWQVILILFTTFFVLLEGKMLARRFAAIFGPSPEVQAKATEVLLEMAMQVRTYLVWRTIVNLGLAVVMGVIFQMFGLSQAWTWAILLAILNYIPYFGPVLAAVPPFLDAFISTEHPAVPIVIMILYWVVILVEGWLIVPLLMGRNMDLNATTVMLACLFWPLVWGPTGLFLAMPIMAGIKAVLHHVPGWRVWADLMSSTDFKDDEPPTSPLLPFPGPGDSANGTPPAHGQSSETGIREV
ncbi:MAG: AI-2E family transporter [Planctomycetes bacterium]|nr:AI-2E family transporter [Planctomycetota bacterium]